MDLQAGDFLVARGWSWSAEALQSTAERGLRAQQAADEPNPIASVSVFAMLHDGSEDVEALKVRLMAYVLTVLRSKYIGFTSSSKLKDEGFVLRLNEPPEHHYDILTPDVTDLTGFQKLSETFEDKRKAAR